MPRYYFHVHDGVSARDDEGTELPDRRTAQREAIALAGRIIAEDAKRIGLGEDWRMEVTDEHGLVLFKRDFHVTGSPDVPQDKASGRFAETPQRRADGLRDRQRRFGRAGAFRKTPTSST